MSVHAFLEKRLYTRVPRVIPVSVFYHNLLIANCYTLNMSVGGILIDSRELGLIQYSLVQIMFDVNDRHELYNVLIPAVVKRLRHDQFALCFETIIRSVELLLRDDLGQVQRTGMLDTIQMNNV